MTEQPTSGKPERHDNAATALKTALAARSIVLVGMPGSGKSSVGRRLAQRIGLDFTDADARIEEAANGMSIADIFTKHGEPEFRNLEARVIARLLESGPSVIATGGGAFMRAETRDKVRAHGISLWLSADIPLLLERVKRKNNRPLLQGSDPEGVLRKLLGEREADYRQADITVISRDIPHEEVVDAIVEALNEFLDAESEAQS
jgi:shikimate kinase